ncbi:hypothetical protein [Ectobacillus ponti]|uniref:DUF1643 domain-containing protein n=1 Tax=Ectobacillus ponti TaxID=2961894 RepID=A0AA41XD77_9BACI|nr:hypothetical protein [Ectobacillus ponti]MCP8969946.1 hypothetical protein [Ectobacillus ponti]
MSKPRAYGTFKMAGEYIYRTEAYIQWGESEESLGACLMLNPGSAVLEPRLQRSLHTFGEADGLVQTADPTMQQLIKIVEGIYGEKELAGRLHIYNLFQIQCPKNSKAIDMMEELAQAGNYDVKSSLINIETLQQHPWILFAWGVERRVKWTHLRVVKDEWRKRVKEAGIPSFGKEHPKHDEYYHVCPHVMNKRAAMVTDLIRIYRDTVV